MSLDGQMSEALQNMAVHRAASHAVDRRGWTSQQWADDAQQLMSDLDGSVSSLLNGHVLGLIAERDAAVARAEAAEQNLIDAAGFDMADLMRSLDDCVVRAERAEARAGAAEQAVARVRELLDDLPNRYAVDSGNFLRVFHLWQQDLRRSLDEEADRVEAAAIDAAHIEHQRQWSTQTFGPGLRLGVIDHIRKELVEVEADPTDLNEWADVIILGFDGAWRAGHEPQQIIDTVKAKQARNEARTWPDWRSTDRDKAIEHVRTLDGTP